MSKFVNKINLKIFTILMIIILILVGIPNLAMAEGEDNEAPTIIAQPIAKGSDRTSGEMLLGTKPSFLIQDNKQVMVVCYTWNKYIDNKGFEGEKQCLIENTPTSVLWTVPETPAEPGLWELSVYAYDGKNVSIEKTIPYYIVEKLSGKEDTTAPVPVNYPKKGLIETDKEITISFEDDTGVYKLYYLWSENEVTMDVVNNANSKKVYKPENNQLKLTTPSKPGHYYLEFFAWDGTNNENKDIFIIDLTVRKDIIPPKVSLIGGTRYIEVGDNYIDQGANISDDYDDANNLKTSFRIDASNLDTTTPG